MRLETTWIDTARLSRRGARGGGALTRAGMRFEELPSATLRVRSGGSEGRAVVSLPDAPNVIEHHDRLFELLEDWARPVCAELPGTGFSVPARGYRFTIDDAATTVTELLEELDGGPYVLAFSCATAYIALRIAAARPELVSALALIQAPSWPQELEWGRRLDRLRTLRAPVLGQLTMLATDRAVARGWYDASLPKDVSDEERRRFVDLGIEALDNGGQFCLASMFQGMLRAEERFEPVDLSTLVVWGGADRTHRHSDGRSIAEHAPDARWIEFPEAGHFPELEQPARFSEALRQHLRCTL